MKQTTFILYILVVTAILLIVLGILEVRKRNRVAEGFQDSPVPKTIWTFWDKEETVPQSVKLCMESWKNWNPDYTITLVTRANYKDYVQIPDSIATHPLYNDSHQRFSDLIRLYLIAQKGGVWCDSTILLGQPFSEWMSSKGGNDKDLYGFTIVFGNIHDRLPIIESWFFAAPPKSPFVLKWRDEFSKLSEYNTHKDYVQSRVAMGVDLRDYSVSPEYLAIHVAAQKVLQIDKYPLDRLSLQASETGPFRYLTSTEWNSQKALELACKDASYRKPFLKLRGSERQVLENGMNAELSNATCKWV